MHTQATQFASDIVGLARKAAASKQLENAARREARNRSWRPLVYMRYGEFEAVLREVKLRPGMSVVDFSSPQWLSLTLAAQNPSVDFLYTNIIDAELAQYKEIAAALGLHNIRF